MKETAAHEITMFETATDPRNDTPHRDAFDDLVMRAARGDRRAIGAIAVALGPTLMKEARTVLGDFEDDADDVLQDFFVFLLEKRWPTPPPQGRAMHWMCVIVRTFAHERRKESERHWALDDEDDE
jgi:DNA-directed RNA polymerase specialized sigma24 family protein